MCTVAAKRLGALHNYFMKKKNKNIKSSFHGCKVFLETLNDII